MPGSIHLRQLDLHPCVFAWTCKYITCACLAIFKNTFLIQAKTRMIRSAGDTPDLSPPIAGHVYDVVFGTPDVDIDYAVS